MTDEPAIDRTKVLYVALDACDTDTMLRLVATGRCPTLGGLLQDAAVAPTVAPYGTFVSSAWVTMTTARRVGRHRYYNWIALDRGTYEYRQTSPREAEGTPFWQQLSDQGHRVAVLDVPHSDLPDQLDGAFLKEWGCHDRHHGPASLPPTLLEQLGDHPYGSGPPPGPHDQFAPCDNQLRSGWLRTMDEERQLLDLLMAGAAAKADASGALLRAGGWDAFVTVLGEGHCVGHQLWHVHDTAHPRHDPATRRVLGDPVAAVYERLDAAVGQHLHDAGPGATAFVHLSHGMQAHYDGEHLLDAVLERIDAADTHPTTGRLTAVARALFGRLPARTHPALRRTAAAAVRARLRRSPAEVSAIPGPRPGRRWYQELNNTVYGGIRLSIEGRERDGCLAAHRVDEAVTALTAALLEVVNVDTGAPAILDVVRSDDVLERSLGDAFPDLFVEWDRRAPIERVWSPTIGTVVAPYEHWRTGDHHERGLLLVRGPGIEAGPRPSLALEDLAPTLSAALGAELVDVDGRPRLDLLGPRPAPNLAAGPARVATPRARRPPRPRPRSLLDGALELAAAAARRSDLGADAQRQAAALREELEEVQRANLVWTTMRWLEGVDVPDDRLISVITPTHERPEQLATAIGSVLAQTYQRWEMVIVDDGGDTAKSVVAQIGDDRVRAHRIRHGGPGRARNEALRLATGDLITYLDDDNQLDRGWLKAVAWAFRNHPDHEVLYGARLIDDVDRVHGRQAGGWPWLQFNRFDRGSLRQGNLADMGVLAHRAGLPEAHFDEALAELADWDFFLAITEHRTPLELPAVAVRYTTEGSDRLSGRHVDELAAIRRRWPTKPGGA